MGFVSYEVGGSLRDEILGKEGKDLDVCIVGSSYEEIAARAKEMGCRAEPLEVAGTLVGLRIYAPWTPPEGVELALARKEVSTGEGHKDFAFETSPDVTIEEDLLRRDFTCNAVAREILQDGSPGKWIDPLGGRRDTENGILRAVSKRVIEEDPLRILRGLVRVSRDGLIPDEETKRAMIDCSSSLAPQGALSPERVWAELEKIISGDGADRALSFMLKADRQGTIWKNVFPELASVSGFDQRSRYHDLPLDEHTLLAVRVACQNGYSREVRLAALLHDAGKPETAWEGDDGFLHYYANKKMPGSRDHAKASEEIARGLLCRLRAPRKVEQKVCLLVREHMYALDPNGSRAPLKARKLVARVGRKSVDELLQLRRCDHLAKKEAVSSAGLEKAERLVAQAKSEPVERGDLVISGDDILSFGARGQEVGNILDEIMRRVLANPESNNRETLLRWAERLAS